MKCGRAANLLKRPCTLHDRGASLSTVCSAQAISSNTNATATVKLSMLVCCACRILWHICQTDHACPALQVLPAGGTGGPATATTLGLKASCKALDTPRRIHPAKSGFAAACGVASCQCDQRSGNAFPCCCSRTGRHSWHPVLGPSSCKETKGVANSKIATLR